MEPVSYLITGHRQPVFEEAPGPLDALPERLAAVGRDEVARVLPGRQRGDQYLQVLVQQHSDAALRRLLARLVRVEDQHHPLAQPVQHARVVLRQRRAQHRQRLLHALLVGHDDVRVALQQHGRAARAYAGPCLREAEEAAPLAEERRLRAVQVLGLILVAERPGAEADDAAGRVADREHQAVAEPVVAARRVLPAYGQPGAGHHLRADVALGGQVQDVVPAVRRVAQPPFLDGLLVDAAAGQVVARPRARLALEQALLVVVAGQLVESAQPAGLVAAGSGFGLVSVQVDAGVRGQLSEGLAEAQALHLLKERENIAPLFASEAVVEPLFGVDREGGGLFFVERAASPVVLPLARQLAVPADYPQKIHAAKYLLDDVFRYTTCHVGPQEVRRTGKRDAAYIRYPYYSDSVVRLYLGEPRLATPREGNSESGIRSAEWKAPVPSRDRARVPTRIGAAQPAVDRPLSDLKDHCPLSGRPVTSQTVSRPPTQR